jgi:hypothetical protein
MSGRFFDDIFGAKYDGSRRIFYAFSGRKKFLQKCICGRDVNVVLFATTQ